MEDALIGSQLGQYRIEELLGRGGMASVYRAHQETLRRSVAIKVLPTYFANDPDFSERFRREALAVAQLEHPNILPVYDFGQERGTAYIVMPLVTGGTLRDRLGGPLPLDWSIRVCDQLARALDHAHARNIVHRDVKPANVLLSHDDWALLADFGIARIVGASTALTRSGIGVGTPEYLSPEQGQGLPVDGRSDVYSLAMTLFEMLSGQLPYEAETPIGVVYKQVNGPVPSLRAFWADAPPGIDEVLQRGLAKRPEDRFDTAGQFVDALRHAAGVADPAGAAGIGAQPAPPLPTRGGQAVVGPARPSRLRAALLIGAVAAALVVGIGAFVVRDLASRSLEAPPAGSLPPVAADVGLAPAGAQGVGPSALDGSPGLPTGESPSVALLEETPTVAAPTDTAIPRPTETPVPRPTSPPPRPTDPPTTAPPPPARPPPLVVEPRPEGPLRAEEPPPRDGVPLIRLAVQVIDADCARAVGRVTAGAAPARDVTLKLGFFRPGLGLRSLGDDVQVPGPEFRIPYPTRLPPGQSELRIVAVKPGLAPSAPATATVTC